MKKENFNAYMNTVAKNLGLAALDNKGLVKNINNNLKIFGSNVFKVAKRTNSNRTPVKETLNRLLTPNTNVKKKLFTN
jgi:hypothetical protein